MTAPLPQPQQQPEQLPPPEDGQGPSAAEAAAIAAIAAYLAAQVAGAAIRRPAELIAMIVRLGVPRRAVIAAWQVTMRAATIRITLGRVGGVASARTARQEASYRAAFLVNASRRIWAGLQAGRSLADLVEQEARNLQAHIDAQRARAAAAAAVDKVVDAAGGPSAELMLLWVATLDARTTLDCRQLHGQLFAVDKPPGGRYPGQVHPRCRCVARAVTVPVQPPRAARRPRTR